MIKRKDTLAIFNKILAAQQALDSLPPPVPAHIRPDVPYEDISARFYRFWKLADKALDEACVFVEKLDAELAGGAA